jgi:hypothetical protein
MEAKIFSGRRTGLHTVGSDNVSRVLLNDDQMVTDRVKVILIDAGGMRAGQPLVQLEVEDLKPEAEGLDDLLIGAGKADGIRWPTPLTMDRAAHDRSGMM